MSTTSAARGGEEHRIGVVAAEDDPAMRTALRALLSQDPSIDLLGVGADTDEAIALAVRHQPRVCIVDVKMPGGGGPHATRCIRERCPGTSVLALSGSEDRNSVVEMLRAGASGYVLKGDDPEELLRAVHAAGQGRRSLSARVAEGVVDELAEQLAGQEAARARRSEVAARIDRVLEARRLDIALQPIVELATREVVGFEALARFVSEPVRSPALWFAEAAETGRLLELELAAARAAFAHLAHLPAAVWLSVNVSPATAAADAFHAALPAGEASRRIVVEITEHAPIADYDAFGPTIERLRRRGVRLAIDDAGAGFASLRHILGLGPEVIKLDMSLTRRIETDRAERALAGALITFAAETDAEIVAEGIESESELEALRDLGVRLGQGFHLGRPQLRCVAVPGDGGAARDVGAPRAGHG